MRISRLHHRYVLAAAIAAAGLTACGRGRDAASGARVALHDAAAPTDAPRRQPATPADSFSLDSCARLDAQARPQQRVREPGETDEAVPAPSPGAWSETRRVALDGFSIEVPTVTSVGHNVDTGHVVISDLPGCAHFCIVEIMTEPDSAGAGLDAWIARVRTSDPTDPEAGDWVPGPPQPIRLGPDRGALMEVPCGDCGESEIVTERGGRIAVIDFSISDPVGYQPGLTCRLTRVAASFRWNRS